MFENVVQTLPLQHHRLLNRSLSLRSTLSTRIHRLILLLQQQRLLRTVSRLVSPRAFRVLANLQTERRRPRLSRLGVVLVLVLVLVLVHRLSTSLLVLVKAAAIHLRLWLPTVLASHRTAVASRGSKAASSISLPQEDRALPSNSLCLVVACLELLRLRHLRPVPRLLLVRVVSLVQVLRALLPALLR